MVTYDSKLIYTFADRLYQQAQRIVVSYTVGWGLIGLIVGFTAGVFVEQDAGGAAYTGAFVAAGLLGAVGYSQGQARAFSLRLQAQMALCSVAIEENTRVGVNPKG